MKRSKKSVVWVIDHKNSFAMVEECIAGQVLLHKFESIKDLNPFRKKQEKESKKGVVYPDFVFFFPRISAHRIIEVSAASRMVSEIKTSNPKTIVVAFCSVPRMQHELSRQGFEVQKFSGGQSIKDLFGVGD
jgi:hypothetical protein